MAKVTPDSTRNVAPEVTPEAKRRPVGVKTGVVVSDKRDKTRTVEVSFTARNSKYGKYLRHKSRVQVHDESNSSGQGDQVQITNCRPISKTKSWRLLRIVKKAAGEATHQEQAEVTAAAE